VLVTVPVSVVFIRIGLFTAAADAVSIDAVDAVLTKDVVNKFDCVTAAADAVAIVDADANIARLSVKYKLLASKTSSVSNTTSPT
jgi:hypothetical protein